MDIRTEKILDTLALVDSVPCIRLKVLELILCPIADLSLCMFVRLFMSPS